jgi:integrase
MPKTKIAGRDGVYTRPDRKGFWISWFDAQGRRRQEKTDAPTLQQARDILAQKRAEAEKQRVLGYAPPSRDTFAEFAPRYLKHQKARLTARAYERSRGIVEKHLRSAFGPLRLAEIRRGDVQRYVTNRSAAVVVRGRKNKSAVPSDVRPAPRAVGAGSVAKELNVLKHMLGLAVEWEMIPVNYAHGVKPPKAPAGRVRYLQATEVQNLLAACPAWLQPVMLLLLATGMRRGELLGLRWLDVDRLGNRIQLPQTKNGDGRTVWLNALACRVIDSLPRNDARPTDRVFPKTEHTTPENVSLTFLRTCRRVGIEDFRLHDLRHTCASWMRMKGADIHVVALQLGHKDLRQAARYQHLAPAFLQDAVRGLDGVFGPELVAAGPQGAPIPQTISVPPLSRYELHEARQ